MCVTHLHLSRAIYFFCWLYGCVETQWLQMPVRWWQCGVLVGGEGKQEQDLTAHQQLQHTMDWWQLLLHMDGCLCGIMGVFCLLVLHPVPPFCWETKFWRNKSLMELQLRCRSAGNTVTSDPWGMWWRSADFGIHVRTVEATLEDQHGVKQAISERGVWFHEAHWGWGRKLTLPRSNSDIAVPWYAQILPAALRLLEPNLIEFWAVLGIRSYANLPWKCSVLEY